MLDSLVLHNFPSGFIPEMSPDSDHFIMSTCQRTIVLSYGNYFNFNQNIVPDYDYFLGNEAYTFLLEIICGLKSKLIGENEIVGQFKNAYKDYIQGKSKNTKLILIIEKLFKDAKEIRTNYLLGLSQKTYSSIARKHIVSKHKAKSVLILGSGQLAEDLINQFKKKVDVYICARNTEVVQNLVKEHNIQYVPWDNFDQIQSFPFIVNSIGFKGVLFNESFFTDWAQKHDKKLFVDLGSPSIINTKLNYDLGVMKLDDVFKEGAIRETHKKQQIDKARKALDGIVEKRHRVLKEKKLNNPYNKAKHAYA